MNKNEEQIKADWAALDKFRIEEALKQLLYYEKDVRSYLVKCIASLCDVDENRILTNTDVVYIAHARWLYWYAYRYMTNESYEKMSINTARDGHKFGYRSIQGGVNKMAMMIAEEPLWQKRWNIIKRIIKLRDSDDEVKFDSTITISVPKHLREVITFKIQEK